MGNTAGCLHDSACSTFIGPDVSAMRVQQCEVLIYYIVLVEGCWFDSNSPTDRLKKNRNVIPV